MMVSRVCSTAPRTANSTRAVASDLASQARAMSASAASAFSCWSSSFATTTCAGRSELSGAIPLSRRSTETPVAIVVPFGLGLRKGIR